MKWTNKGHEFDECLKVNKIAIFGAGKRGQFIYNELKNDFIIVCFLDNDEKKQREKLLGLPVYSFAKFIDEYSSIDIMCIVSVDNDDNCNKIIAQMVKSSIWALNKNLFKYEQFLSIYYYYKKNKLILPSCVISVTERCTLKCKHCNQFMPYFKSPCDTDISLLKKDVDMLFQTFDKVEILGLSGGESLLYPELSEIIEYIMMRYRNQIWQLRIFTNGTVMPTENMMKAFCIDGVRLMLSDYTVELPFIESKHKMFCDCLERNKIDYDKLVRVDKWVQYIDETGKHNNASDEEMNIFYNNCQIPCHLVSNGKFYMCLYAEFANRSGVIQDDGTSSFDLANLDENERTALFEFIHGYNDKGYLNMCRKCNGHVNINKNYIPVAEQIMQTGKS